MDVHNNRRRCQLASAFSLFRFQKKGSLTQIAKKGWTLMIVNTDEHCCQNLRTLQNKYFLYLSIVSEKSLVIGQIKAQRGFVYCLFKLIQFGLGTRLTKRLNLSTKCSIKC